MTDVLALIYLSLAWYFAGQFAAERRAGQPNPRGEFFTVLGAAWSLTGVAVFSLMQGEPAAVRIVVPAGATVIAAVWLWLARRARKGARPDVPLPK